MEGIIYFEDGTLYRGKGFGRMGTAVGEMVFNTAITGYQEILTDPSYAGQIITMTYPLIGNYGVSLGESESDSIYARGLVVRSISNHPSNYKSESTLAEMMQKLGLPGVSDVDTRSITRKIRTEGVLKGIISTEVTDVKGLEQLLAATNLKEDWMKVVGVRKTRHLPGDGCRVALLDLGVKGNMIRELQKRHCDIMMVPYGTTLEQIKAYQPNGLLVSNGPGNPETAVEGIHLVQQLMTEIPIFGICMGHQLLAHAVGGKTYKMKYGHRGGNHGVYDVEKDRAYITSQNHGYAVETASVKEQGMIITHTNLNDQTVEGMKHIELPVFSVQFHPEGAPGPTDTEYLFDQFVTLMKERGQCR
ncbi:MAG: glutamine-hydrolyzing carbamoyl-phosphate synthase small subunit [Bacillota bacterium]|nr:glutamine-hydrolyzing carbamoyl-phosphate synthase small subunit [Bacillota bacterium]MDW7676620.1 glutamine-hydrolyzing carbamoyl-phosphate synthase small subunit [Bacillota bacterium]